MQDLISLFISSGDLQVQSAALDDLIKANKVKAVFSEAGLNPKLTEAVAKEAGVAFVGALYIDTLSDATGPAAAYIDMIRYNTVTSVGAPR